MYKGHPKSPCHTTFDKPFDRQPLEERRQESFESFELGAEQRISAAAVGHFYHVAGRDLTTVERSIIGIQPQ